MERKSIACHVAREVIREQCSLDVYRFFVISPGKPGLYLFFVYRERSDGASLASQHLNISTQREIHVYMICTFVLSPS